MDTFITYEGLPINSGGSHSLGKKPIDIIYFDTLNFLQNFTNCDKPKEFDLTFYSSQNGSYKTLPIVWDLTKRFGIPAFRSWDLGTSRQPFFTWKLKHGDADKGFKTLRKYVDLPQNEYGPIVLSFKWQFYFIDHYSKTVLSGQEKIPIIDDRQQNSQLYLRLGQKSTVSVWFAFPFESLNENTLNYLKSLFERLPFTPSEKHWKIWQKSIKGNWIPKAIQINAS